MRTPAPDVRCPDTLPRHEHDLCLRVQGEFRDMPGLRVTLPQASRLFGMEPARCERVLDALVHAGALATNGRMFMRADSGRRSA